MPIANTLLTFKTENQTAKLICCAWLSMVMFACSDVNNSDNKVASQSPLTNNSLEQTTSTSNQQETTQELNQSTQFFENTMNAAPFLPSNLSINSQCDLPLVNENAANAASEKNFLSSSHVNYQTYGWEEKIAHDWSFFPVTKERGRVVLIDIKQEQGMPVYRYLANDQSHNDLYEPWSSSKIFAYTGAIAQLRKRFANDDIGANGIIGEHHIADMITSINSYEAFGKADGNSNALATFFANLATRDYLSALFYDEWLKLSTPNIYFRGAYGPTAFEPSSMTWRALDGSKTQSLEMNNVASDDPGYLPYRCDNCGLTGNKPMTTLAQAEWLKRLAMHSKDPSTAHPYLQQSDVDTLLYGVGHSQSPKQFAGMTLGISTMLQQAMAVAIAPEGTEVHLENAKQILDEYSDGKWRVFQKIGWGPSETRSTSENVVLAYVCLPAADAAKQSYNFVVAAQVAVPEAKEENVALAGIKMQNLLEQSLQAYIKE